METKMQAAHVTVTFLQGEINIDACAGDTVLDAALDNGFELPHECGGNCACTTCHIRIESGVEKLSVMEAVEDDRLATTGDRSPQSRLACQAILLGGPITVTPLEMW